MMQWARCRLHFSAHPNVGYVVFGAVVPSGHYRPGPIQDNNLKLQAVTLSAGGRRMASYRST